MSTIKQQITPMVQDDMSTEEICEALLDEGIFIVDVEMIRELRELVISDIYFATPSQQHIGDFKATPYDLAIGYGASPSKASKLRGNK